MKRLVFSPGLVSSKLESLPDDSKK